MMDTLLTRARSFLFVPGNRPERFMKALTSGADAVVIDLEDAVPLAQKMEARVAIEAAWNAFDKEQRQRLLVRINPATSGWHGDDLALLGQLAELGGVMLPKAESAEQLAAVSRVCPRLPVVPLLESAAGFAMLNDIAGADKVVRLGFGHIDYQVDLGMHCGVDELELIPARWALVSTSRLKKLAPPIDGVTTNLTDKDIIRCDTQRSRQFGFGAKLCIHPRQVGCVHAAFTPSISECDWAKRVLEGEAQAAGNAYSIDGKMVDAPVITLARQLLQRAGQHQ